MSGKLLSAFTALTDMPPYINASLTKEGNIAVIVRGNATVREGGRFPVADCAIMEMSREDFRKWAVEAIDTLDHS